MNFFSANNLNISINSKLLVKIAIAFFLFLSLTSCGIYKKVDSREISVDGMERAKQNVKTGRGVSLGSLRGRNNSGTNYEFSTSNPMWRASLDVLDFLPLSTVDYSGGLIITDWYSDANNQNEALKITVRFLSNEVRSDSLKITVRQKKCLTPTNCPVKKLKSKIEGDLRRSILSKAATLEKQVKK